MDSTPTPSATLAALAHSTKLEGIARKLSKVEQESASIVTKIDKLKAQWQKLHAERTRSTLPGMPK